MGFLKEGRGKGEGGKREGRGIEYYKKETGNELMETERGGNGLVTRSQVRGVMGWHYEGKGRGRVAGGGVTTVGYNFM